MPSWFPTWGRRPRSAGIPTGSDDANFNVYAKYASISSGTDVDLTHAAELCLRASMGFLFGISPCRCLRIRELTENDRNPLPPTLGYDVMLDHVSIGHVGFIDQGRFVLLFDAAQPLGSRRIGREVPNGFTYNNDIGAGRSHPYHSDVRTASTETCGFQRCAGVELGVGVDISG
jgi:hypothetical protein